jgi:hypothetical protein
MGATSPSFDHTESRWSDGQWIYMNDPGQGFDAWLSVHHRTDGPLATEDVWVDDDGYRYLDQKACTVMVNFDTAYGYQDRLGGCASLHGRYIVMLDRWAKDHGATLEWRNEFTGEFFKGLDGLEDFGGEEVRAAEWLDQVYQLIKEDVVKDVAKRMKTGE